MGAVGACGSTFSTAGTPTPTPTGADYFDRRDRVAAAIGVEPRRIMLHTYPGQPTRLAVSVFNRPMVDLMRDTAYADD